MNESRWKPKSRNCAAETYARIHDIGLHVLYNRRTRNVLEEEDGDDDIFTTSLSNVIR